MNDLFPNWLDMLQECHGQLVPTGSPAIFCSALPSHWRCHKQLLNTFKVIVLDSDIPDGTEVLIAAGNGNVGKFCSHLKNNTAQLKDGVAEFHNLRFAESSGRCSTFQLTITILASISTANANMQMIPDQIAIVDNAIKITVDGPREPRTNNKQSKFFILSFV